MTDDTPAFWRRIEERLAELEAQTGLKRGPTWLGKKADLSLPILRKYRLNLSRPKQPAQARIAKALELPVEELFPEDEFAVSPVSDSDEAEDSRREYDYEADPAWVASVETYLDGFGADTPHEIRDELFRVPYKAFRLSPEVLTDVHTAREVLERQWRKQSDPRPNVAKEPENRREEYRKLKPVKGRQAW